MVGGAGNDYFVFNATGDVIVEANTVAGGIDAVLALVGNSGATTFSIAARPELENVQLGTLLVGSLPNAIGNAKDNVLLGNTFNNSLVGAAGNDTLKGSDGNDTLDGGAGIDSLEGGEGNDLYIVDGTDLVTEASDEGFDTVSTAINGYTLGANLENLILTGTAVNGTGNTLGNAITAGAGNGTLDGGDGNDTLNGGAGNDTLLGGIGDDVFIFDQGDSVQGGAGYDTLKVATTLGTASAPFDFALLATKLDSIDAIDITGTGNNAIHIDIADVAAITDGNEESKTLRIEGNRGANDTNGDFVRSSDNWTLLGLRQSEVGDWYYVEYVGEITSGPNAGFYTLLVHTDITQSFNLV
jgi:hypothetical protein